MTVSCVFDDILSCFLNFRISVDQVFDGNSGINSVNGLIDFFLLAITEVVLKDFNRGFNAGIMVSELLFNLLFNLLLGLFLHFFLEVIFPVEELLVTLSLFIKVLVNNVVRILLIVVLPVVLDLFPEAGLRGNLDKKRRPGGLLISLFIKVLINYVVRILLIVVFPVVLDLFPETGLEGDLLVRSHPGGLLGDNIKNFGNNGNSNIGIGNVGDDVVHSGIGSHLDNLVVVLDDLVPYFLGNLTTNFARGVDHLAGDVLGVVDDVCVGSGGEGGGRE